MAIGTHGGADGPRERTPVGEPPDLGLLLHRLNNQLGIILVNAELLEAKLPDGTNRARACEVVESVLEALATTKELHARLRPPGSSSPPPRQPTG